MKAKKFVLAAIMCAVLSLGIGGTSSAATLTDNFLVATAETTVATQNLALLTRSRDYRHTDVRRGGYQHTVGRGGYHHPTPTPRPHHPTPPHRPHYRR